MCAFGFVNEEYVIYPIIKHNRSVCILDKTKHHSPEKGVGSVVIDFTLYVFPMEILPGGLLHHSSFPLGDLIRTARFERTVAELFWGTLAGGVDRRHAASFRLGLGHGFSNHPPSVPSVDPTRLGLILGTAPVHCQRRQPHPSDCQHPVVVEETDVNTAQRQRTETWKSRPYCWTPPTTVQIDQCKWPLFLPIILAHYKWSVKNTMLARTTSLRTHCTPHCFYVSSQNKSKHF